MSMTSFIGPVRSHNGFIGVGENNVISFPGGTLNLTVEGQAGKQITITDGGTIKLPTIVDEGDDCNFGMQYSFIVLADPTTPITFKTGVVADKMYGTINYCDDAGGLAGFYHTPGTANTISGNGDSTGGDTGSVYVLTCIGANAWSIQGIAVFPTDSTPATPFSTRVARKKAKPKPPRKILTDPDPMAKANKGRKRRWA